VKNSFTVRLVVRLTLSAVGIPPGFSHGILTELFSWFLGAALDKKIIPAIDITLEGWKDAAKIDEFKKRAAEEYKRAQRKALTPAEKQAIREEYLRTLAPVVRFGRGLRDN